MVKPFFKLDHHQKTSYGDYTEMLTVASSSYTVILFPISKGKMGIGKYMYIRLLQNYWIFELVGFVLIRIHSSFFLLLRSYCSTKNGRELTYSSLLLSLRLEQCQNYSKCDERKISFVKLGDKAFLRLRVKFFV